MKRLGCLVVVLAAARAEADPCTDRANDLVARYPTYVTYCEACGDLAPSAPANASRGQPLELAHTYLATSAARYENLAALAGCPVTNVPPSLRVTAETASGVLIMPDWAPVQSPAVATPPPPPAPVVIAVPQLVVVQADEDPPWALLAGIAGLATGAVGVLCAFALRRRHRGGVPRAIELADRPGVERGGLCPNREVDR